MTYTHKLTGQQLTIKKQYGNVFVCYAERFHIKGISLFSDLIICVGENLIKNEYTQTELF